MKINKSLGALFVFLSAVCFSLGGILIKIISWNPVTINGARSLVSIVVMLIYYRIVHRKLKFNRMVLFGAICNCVMNVTFVMATSMTSAANAIVLQFTMPIFVIIFSSVYAHKLPKSKEVVTCIIVFIGIACFFLESMSGGGMLGNLLAVFSGVANALVFMQKSFPKSDFESSAVLSQAFSVIISIPFALRETTVTATDIWAVVLMGVIQMALAYILLAIGLDYVSPVTASITSTIEPILNPILVLIFIPYFSQLLNKDFVYDKQLKPLSIIGAIIVIGAVCIYNVLGARERTNKNVGIDK